MAAKLSPAMIAMIVEASHFRHHEIIGGNSRTLQAIIDRGLAEVKVNTTGGANTVHLTPIGYDTAVTHRPAVEPVEDIVTVTEVVSEADTLADVAERVGAATPDRSTGPRTMTLEHREPNGAVIGWERTIRGTRYRFVLSTNTDNGAVCATVGKPDTREAIRVIPFRKPSVVAVVTPRATQPPVVTLPPRTPAGGMRSVPRKRSGRRSSGWRKAGKR